MSEIKAGDVVQLKSGSVAMTVESVDKIDSGDVANCVWRGQNSYDLIKEKCWRGSIGEISRRKVKSRDDLSVEPLGFLSHEFH